MSQVKHPWWISELCETHVVSLSRTGEAPIFLFDFENRTQEKMQVRYSVAVFYGYRMSLTG